MDFFDKKELFEDEVNSLLEEIDITLVSYILVKQKKSLTLRVAIDRQGGVSHDDCSKVTKMIQALLEEKGYDEMWGIEVSSPGINRVLKSSRELKAFQGRNVQVSYLNDSKLLQETGQLLNSSPQEILIKTDLKEISLSCEDVKKIRLAE